MATTDLHMQLVDHDYVTNCRAPGLGLAGLATLISHAREEATQNNMATILVDNGDTIQGSLFADWVAKQPVDSCHPLVAAFNLLGYDAMGLGNHDFDYGLEYLKSVASQLEMPVVGSNLSGDGTAPIKNSLIVDVLAPGQQMPLKVGILSALPPQTKIWKGSVLDTSVWVDDPQDVMRRQVPLLRKAGADIVVVLAHMGIVERNDPSGVSAQTLSQIKGVDAVVAGHTHDRLAKGGFADRSKGTDAARVPTMMAGHHGSDLGVIDLTLAPTPDSGWSVSSARSFLMPNTATVPACPALSGRIKATHEQVVQRLETPIARTDRGMHSYFTLLQPGPATALLAGAKAHAVRQAVSGTAQAELPLIAAAAPHAAGGLAGPSHYLDFPKGAILRRQLGGVDPFANQVWAVRIDGRGIRLWLERATRIFATLVPDHPDQLLLDRAVPSYVFDAIYGLTYVIDPTCAPDAAGGRIRSLMYNGKPVRDDQVFLLATNKFRATGGGGFGTIAEQDIAVRGAGLTENNFKAAADQIASMPEPAVEPWSLQRDLGLQAVLETSPKAQTHLKEIASFSPEPFGLSARGFLKLRLTL